MAKLVALRLHTGEELVGEVEADDGSLSSSRAGWFVIKHPLRLQIIHTQQGAGLMAEPFMASQDEDIELKVDQVVGRCEPSEDITETWKKKFGTILTPPEPKLIT